MHGDNNLSSKKSRAIRILIVEIWNTLKVSNRSIILQRVIVYIF